MTRSITVNGVRYVAVEAPAKSPNTFYENVIKARIPCAYGSASCKGITFAPNGVGSRQHTTCKPGVVALRSARG